jgi:predicted O-methyltransferase YrrM
MGDGPARPMSDWQGWRPEIRGWSTDILPFYARMAKELGPKAEVVEVGVYQGRSLLFLAERLVVEGKLDARIFAVDPHDWEDGHRDARAFYTNWLTFGDHVMKMVRPLRFTSDVSAAFGDESLDLVFIDGEHDYGSVMADVSAWLPTVKMGGILAGHDYGHPECLGVERAVRELFGGVKVEGTVWWVQR